MQAAAAAVAASLPIAATTLLAELALDFVDANFVVDDVDFVVPVRELVSSTFGVVAVTAGGG